MSYLGLTLMLAGNPTFTYNYEILPPPYVPTHMKKSNIKP